MLKPTLPPWMAGMGLHPNHLHLDMVDLTAAGTADIRVAVRADPHAQVHFGGCT